MWLYNMEWLSISQIYNYKYQSNEKKDIIPFAHTGGGDIWAWLKSDKEEPPVIFCNHDSDEGVFYAKNTSNAFFKQILEFVSDDNFYIEVKTNSYQMSELELKKFLNEWKSKLGEFFTKEQNEILNYFQKKNLCLYDSKYGKWCVLITPEEADCIKNKYLHYDMEEQPISLII